MKCSGRQFVIVIFSLDCVHQSGNPGLWLLLYYNFFSCLFLTSKQGFLSVPVNCDECGSFPGTTRVESCDEGSGETDSDCPETHWTPAAAQAAPVLRLILLKKYGKRPTSACLCGRTCTQRSHSLRTLLTFPNSIHAFELRGQQRFQSYRSFPLVSSESRQPCSFTPSPCSQCEGPWSIFPHPS